MTSRSGDAVALDASDIAPKLIDLISIKDDKAFAKNWVHFKNLVESAKPDSWHRCPERHELLRKAALRGLEEAVKLFLMDSRCPNLDDRKPKTGVTALHEAAYYGHVTVVELLLKNGATADLRTHDTRESALHRVQFEPRLRNPKTSTSLEGTVRAFLKAGANPNLEDWRSCTPVHYAARNSHTGILDLLLDCDGNQDCLDRYGNTPLQLAASMGYADEVDLLLGRSVLHINTENKSKQPPLYLAASGEYANRVTEWSQHDDTVRLLLDRGADIFHQKVNDLTMLDWAAKNSGGSKTADLILRKECMSWGGSWFQELGTSGVTKAPSTGLDHGVARHLFKASAI